MTETLALLFSLVFTNNLLMSGVKMLSTRAESVWWLRMVLMVFALLGVIASAALTGNPIDFNQFDDLGRMLLEAAITALGAHFSYRLIKEAAPRAS